MRRIIAEGRRMKVDEVGMLRVVSLFCPVVSPPVVLLLVKVLERVTDVGPEEVVSVMPPPVVVTLLSVIVGPLLVVLVVVLSVDVVTAIAVV
jgi:hypothetical protein